MTAKRFPMQGDCDPNDPEEHFLWALSQIPFGPYNQQPVQPSLARNISKHLVECGYTHVDAIRELADENGMIHVDQLPAQQKKLQKPYRGQQHYLNASARYVPMDAEEPDPVKLPNVHAMTLHEQELMISELRSLGRIHDTPLPPPEVAEIKSIKDVIPSRIIDARDLLRKKEGE